MKPTQFKQHGITLIELIVAVALLSVVFLAVFFILRGTYMSWQLESRSVSLEGQLRSIEDVMLRDLRPCKSATVVQASPTIRLYFSQTDTIAPTTESSNYFEYNSSNHILYRALVGDSGWAKNALSRNNIVVSPISNIFIINTISPSYLFIQVNLAATEGSTEKEISFSVTTRRPR